MLSLKREILNCVKRENGFEYVQHQNKLSTSTRTVSEMWQPYYIYFW